MNFQKVFDGCEPLVRLAALFIESGLWRWAFVLGALFLLELKRRFWRERAAKYEVQSTKYKALSTKFQSVHEI